MSLVGLSRRIRVSLVVSTITFVSFLAILPRAPPASFSSRSAQVERRWDQCLFRLSELQAKEAFIHLELSVISNCYEQCLNLL